MVKTLEFVEKESMIMAMSTIDKYKVSFDTENINVRDMVIAGLDQVQSNSTKDE